MKPFNQLKHSLVKQYKVAFYHFVPKRIIHNRNKIELTRWHVVVGAHFIALSILPIAFVFEALEFGIFSLMSAINCVLYTSLLSSLWLLKKTENLQSSASLIIASAVGATVATSIYNDGLFDPSISWLVLAPVIAALLGGVKTVVWTTAVSVCSLAILTMCHMYSWVDFPSNLADVSLNHFVQLCLPILFSSLVGSIQGTVTKLATEETERIQKELATEQESFFHSQRLKSLGEMGAGIAHEINNPLTVISGISQLTLKRLEKNILPEEVLNKNLNKIIDTTDRISGIIRSMKRISGYRHFDEDEQSSQNTNLKEELEAALSIQSFNLKGIRLEIEESHDFEQTRVIGRDGEISQVFGELISNAVCAIRDDVNPWISIKIESKPTYVKIFFTDSGLGIDPTVQEKIFQPFYTTRQNKGGTGLGMGVIKAMLESHGGSIKYLESEANTTFEIVIQSARELNEAC